VEHPAQAGSGKAAVCKMGLMPRCLLCGIEGTGFTDEHVFPAALGGGLVVANSTGSDCNNGFSKLEQALATELKPIRLLLKVPDRYGKVPDVEAVAKTQSEDYAAKVLGDGTVKPKRLVSEVVLEDGSKEYVHRFATERQRIKLREEAARKGKEIIESGPGEPVQAEIHIEGDLKEIGSDVGLRVAAKIAYIGMAYLVGSGLALSDSFNQARTFIREGTGKSIARLFVNERFMDSCQQGPHQHSIVLAGRHDMKRVDAIVRLFGGLCYFINLSEEYGGVDFNRTLAYDASRGDINEVLQTNLQGEFLQTEDVATSKDTVWDDLPASGRKFVEFFQQAVDAKMEKIVTAAALTPPE
jgi:hypothetical protein